jgi:hypothetical protein
MRLFNPPKPDYITARRRLYEKGRKAPLLAAGMNGQAFSPMVGVALLHERQRHALLLTPVPHPHTMKDRVKHP